jgi:hypothetical protein
MAEKAGNDKRCCSWKDNRENTVTSEAYVEILDQANIFLLISSAGEALGAMKAYGVVDV